MDELICVGFAVSFLPVLVSCARVRVCVCVCVGNFHTYRAVN